MAKMIDKEPKYEGEKKVWHAFYKNLPSDWVVYNTRSINGREYDFCVISPNMGLFIVGKCLKRWRSVIIAPTCYTCVHSITKGVVA